MVWLVIMHEYKTKPVLIPIVLKNIYLRTSCGKCQVQYTFDSHGSSNEDAKTEEAEESESESKESISETCCNIVAGITYLLIVFMKFWDSWLDVLSIDQSIVWGLVSWIGSSIFIAFAFL